MNPRITPKERGLLKGAIRRVFSRSDLRRTVIEKSRIEHSDSSRPRVKKWSVCEGCKNKTPTYQVVVDHINPIIPVNNTLEKMTWDSVINRTWCGINNLQNLCTLCHATKTRGEKLLRMQHKNKGKLNGTKCKRKITARSNKTNCKRIIARDA